MEVYDEVVSGRVSTRQKLLLKKSGYNVRDAVEFLLKYTDKDKRLVIDKLFLEKEMQALRNKISMHELEYANFEKKLEEFDEKLRILNIDESLIKMDKVISVIAHRNPLNKSIRHEVFKRDNYRCVECGATNNETILHVDHILPVSQGGSDELDNLQTLCEECNLCKFNRCWKSGVE